MGAIPVGITPSPLKIDILSAAQDMIAAESNPPDPTQQAITEVARLLKEQAQLQAQIDANVNLIGEIQKQIDLLTA